MDTAFALLITAYAVIWLAIAVPPVALAINSLTDEPTTANENLATVAQIISLVSVLATIVTAVGGVSSVLTSSQLNANHWEIATGCQVDVEWGDGLKCLIAALAFLVVTMYNVAVLPRDALIVRKDGRAEPHPNPKEPARQEFEEL